MTNNRTANAWIAARAAGWQALSDSLPKLRGRRQSTLAESQRIVESYRDLRGILPAHGAWRPARGWPRVSNRFTPSCTP